jgi:hypothetical protein
MPDEWQKPSLPAALQNQRAHKPSATFSSMYLAGNGAATQSLSVVLPELVQTRLRFFPDNPGMRH